MSACTRRSPAEIEAAQKELLREIGLPVSRLDSAVKGSGARTDTQTNATSGSGESPMAEERTGDHPGSDQAVASVAENADGAPSAVVDGGVATPDSAIETAGAGTARIEPNTSQVKNDPRTQPWIEPSQLPRLTWEIQYAGNQPVGYVRRSVEPAKSHGLGALRVEAEARTVLQRNGKAVDQRMQMVSIESEIGELIRIEGTIQNGSKRTRFNGVPKGGRLQIEVLNEAGRTTQSLPWDASMRGPFAIEQSLLRRPMQPKELREVRYFDPFQMVVVNAKLEALDVLETALLDGASQPLLEIQSTAVVGANETRALLWIDGKGESQKSYLPGIDVRSFRCDPVTARYVVSRSEMEAISLREVALFGNVRLLENARQATFRIDVKNADSKFELPSRTDQVARQDKPRSWEVTVFDVEGMGESPEGLDHADRATDQYLQGTPLLNTNHAALQQFVKQALVAGEIADDAAPQLKAESLRQAVSSKWPTAPFDKRIRSVAELFKAKQADCVDQAMVLCAALRVAKIPSRVAYGLRFNGSKVRPMMSFHAWTEYHDGTKWMPLDASRSDAESRPDRVKFSDSPLLSLNGYEPILNILRLIPELGITLAR
ncbi:MAG: transglutaminase-like domain-containing protein [Pirellula sp.]